MDSDTAKFLQFVFYIDNAGVLLLHRNTAGADLGNIPVQSLPVFRYDFYNCRKYHSVPLLPAYRRAAVSVGNGDYLFPEQRNPCIFWLLQYLLHQYVHIPGICGNLSGNAGSAYVYHPYQGEMAWDRLRSHAGI